MKDRNIGMVMATLVVAPVVIVCCGGSIVVFSLIAGAASWLASNYILMSGLVAVVVGILTLAYKSYQRTRCHKFLNEEERIQNE